MANTQHDGVNVGAFLTNRARLKPNAEAWFDVSTDRHFSYAQFNERSNRTAHLLLDQGIKKGDRVALLAMNSAEFMESFFAIAKIGAVCVPLNWRLTPPELEFILKDSGSLVVIHSEEFLEQVQALQSLDAGKTDVKTWICIGNATPPSLSYERLQEAASPEEPDHAAFGDENLYIMYTSGTTGLPKGVVHTHNTAFWAVATMAATIDFYQTDSYLCCLPLFHVGALSPATANLYMGGRIVCPRAFDPGQVWDLIERNEIQTMLAVPAMLNVMSQMPQMKSVDTSNLRWCMSGAAPVPINLIKEYADRDVEIRQVYGLTETCGPACVTDSESSFTKAGSTGPAFYHTKVRVVRDDGSDVADGEVGEVIVSGQHIMKEYWNRPDATAETLKNGWLHTGDLATIDADGFVTIADRKKDMIISGGENIYPAEVENVILGHPKVADVGVIGRDSQKWGEVPMAIVVKGDDSLTEKELIDYCQGKLARFKQPKSAVFIDEIPRNPSGKILKRILRDQFPDPAPE